MGAWSRGQQWVATVGATATAMGFALATRRIYGSFWKQPDASWYLLLARGKGSEVIQPFASRQLYALSVRGLAAVLGWPVGRAFVAVGVVCLVFTLAVIFRLMVRTGAPRWMLGAAAVLPFWPQMLAGLVLPDIWYAALLAVLLLLLERRWWWAAAAMMLPLMVSRESTSLTLVCLLLAGWRELRWPRAAFAVLCTGAGGWIVHALTAGGPGNSEKLPQAVYLLAKVPWNGMRNLLGIQPWSNLYPFLCQRPRWLWAVHLGPVRALGVCSVNGMEPVMALIAEVTVFGVLPALAIVLWWRQRGQREDVLLRFCVLYGGLGFLLAPVLGTAVGRLVGYGWPLPLVAAPILAGRLSGGWRAGGLLAAHFALCLLALVAARGWL